MYIPIKHSTRLLTFTAATTACISGLACSNSEKSPTLETAASTAAAPPPVMRAADTPEKTTSAPPATSGALPKARATTPPPAASEPRPTPEPSPAPASEKPATPGQDKWLSYDAATNTVTFELIGGPRGFEFNGYANGSATLTVPSEAKVVMNFVNKDGTPHSAEIISGEGPLPSAGVDAAIPRAYTRQLSQGLAQEEGDVMRFTVPKSGTYRIFCGVSGHGPSGMWIWMKVDPAAKVPSFEPTKG